MRDNILKRWLNSNNCLLDKNTDLKPTHFFLDGGKAVIDFDKLDEFHEVCVDCINKDIPVYVIECKTSVFRLFSDLDFASPTELSEEFIMDIIGTIHSSVSYLYSGDQKVIVCNTTNKKVTKNGKELVKQGFHLFWPDIYVDTKTALNIRSYVLDKIKIIYGERDEPNTWADVLDEVVYKSNGIRMNGSCKMNILTTADNKRRFQTENRKYGLYTIINANKDILHTEIQKMTNLSELLKNTTIRSDKTEITEIANKEPLSINSNKYIACEDCEETNDKHDDDDFYMKRVNKNNVKFGEILKFFDIHASNKYYKTSDIKGILHIEKSDTYILKTNSKYCQNIQRNHNSCGIYFMLTKNGLCQKCYCKCNTLDGRLNGYCKNYSSEPIPCSLQIIRALKWEQKKKNPKKAVDGEILPISLGKKNISYQSKVGIIRENIYKAIIS